MNDHYAAGVVRRIEGDVRKYLIVRYYSSEADYIAKRNVQIKFPGGTNRDFPDEPLYDTLHREYVSETGIILPARPVQIWVSPPKSSKLGGIHTQHFFFSDFSDCRGTLRSEVMNDNGDWLAPPEWMKEEELDRVIFHSHRPAFERAKSRP